MPEAFPLFVALMATLTSSEGGSMLILRISSAVRGSAGSETLGCSRHHESVEPILLLVDTL